MRRLFWDIETSPNIGLFWSSGWKITIPPENIIQERAVICICYKWEGSKKVNHLTWNRGDDRDMIEEFMPVLNEADELVAHNGDRFDLRWYNGRHLIHGLDPVPIAKTVDTLKIAKRRFYLNSNKLDYLAKVLFGEGKIGTEFGLWKKILLENDPAAMRSMVRYCKKDVVLLERVWERLSSYEVPASHAAVVATGDPKDRWMCPHCGCDDVYSNKRRTTAKGMVQHQMKCKGCDRYYTIANAVYGYYKKAKNS